MQQVKSIAVFCGSKKGANASHTRAAERLGELLAENDIQLIYGGGRIGLMGFLADAVLAAGGRVTGVIPEFLLAHEVGHADVTELITVTSMHERKYRMFCDAEAFVSLPGGLGTLDETMEIITWKQLRLHDKPMVLADLDGRWSGLLALVDDVVAGGFAHPKVKELYTVVTRVDDVFDAISAAPEPSAEVLTSHL